MLNRRGIGIALGLVMLAGSGLAAPVNDDCANAIPISLGESVSGTTDQATDSGQASCLGTDPLDVWYAYTAEFSGQISVTICNGSFDSTLSLFDGCGGNLLACNDDSFSCGGPAYLSSRLSCVPVIEGETYLLRVSGWMGEFGPFNFVLATDNCTPPSNDDCADAIPIFEGSPYAGNSTGATGVTTSSCSINDRLDVWHEYTATANTTLDFVTCGSAFDTTLAIYDDCDGVELACGEDNCDRAARVNDFVVSAGMTYKIRVAGYADDHGPYTLAVLDAALPMVSLINPNQLGPTNADTINFQVQFDQSVQNFNDATDIILHENGVSHSSVAFSGSNQSYTVSIGGITGDGTLALEVNLASDITNLSGVPLSYTETSREVAIDNTAPQAVLSSPAGDPVNAGIAVQLALSESASDFTEADLTLNNAEVIGFAGSEGSYQFTLSPLSEGSFSVEVLDSAFNDRAGNPNLASNSLERSYVAVPVNVELSSSAAAFVNSPIVVNATLSQASATFDEADVALVNCSLSDFSGSATNYSFTLVPDAEGVFSASVPPSSFTDLLGNTNTASNLLLRTMDTTDPVFGDIEVTPNVAAAGESVQIRFVVDEDLSAAPDVLVNGNTAQSNGKATFAYSYIVGSGDPLGLAEVSVSGFDLAGNAGGITDVVSLTIVPPAQEIPVVAWPTILMLSAIGIVMLRRNN